MANHNPKNERIKRQYLIRLKEAKRQSEATVDAVAKALARFEEYTKYRDFNAFHYKQAIAFRDYLANQDSQVTGKKLSKATLHSTLANLKRFFEWLSDRPGYKKAVNYTDAEYFNMSNNDARVATARREKPFPTMDQVKRVIATMTVGTDIEKRNRALVAFTLLTGARDGAIASMKLKHVDLTEGYVFQDARDVKTKFRKTFTTYFFPVGDEIRQIVVDWVIYLREEKLWGNDDPLFPSTDVSTGANQRFGPVGLKREHWSSAGPIRRIFREAFTAAGLPYFNPHTLRDTLVQLGYALCQRPEDMKAWSKNLGHESVQTTLNSYGQLATRRQGEIIKSLAEPKRSTPTIVDATVEQVLRRLKDIDLETTPSTTVGPMLQPGQSS